MNTLVIEAFEEMYEPMLTFVMRFKLMIDIEVKNK